MVCGLVLNAGSLEHTGAAAMALDVRKLMQVRLLRARAAPLCVYVSPAQMERHSYEGDVQAHAGVRLCTSCVAKVLEAH